jgi:hypothetical protein
VGGDCKGSLIAEIEFMVHVLIKCNFQVFSEWLFL